MDNRLLARSRKEEPGLVNTEPYFMTLKAVATMRVSGGCRAK